METAAQELWNGPLSRFSERAGPGPKAVMVATGTLLEMALPELAKVPRNINGKAGEFIAGRAGRTGWATWCAAAFAEIPVGIGVGVVTRPELGLAAALCVKALALGIRASARRDIFTSLGLESESLAVRGPVKAVGILAEAVLPTILSHGKTERIDIKMWQALATVLDTSGLIGIAGGLLTGNPDLATLSLAMYGAGRMMMLSSEGLSTMSETAGKDWKKLAKKFNLKKRALELGGKAREALARVGNAAKARLKKGGGK